MDIREEFREYLRESKSQDDIIEILQDLVGTDNKIDEYMWDFFEKNIPSIYAGDATPEDYLEELSKKSNARLATKLYDTLKSKFKGKLNEGKVLRRNRGETLTDEQLQKEKIDKFNKNNPDKCQLNLLDYILKYNGDTAGIITPSYTNSNHNKLYIHIPPKKYGNAAGERLLINLLSKKYKLIDTEHPHSNFKTTMIDTKTIKNAFGCKEIIISSGPDEYDVFVDFVK